jgi:arsenite oxidase small subunit
VAPLAKIEVGAEIPFQYPDAESPAVLVRLDRPAEGGVGPGQSIVAYSALCTHKGCPVSFKKSHSMLLCACHWSSFDPAKGGRMVIGQASEPLPQISLHVSEGVVRAIGVAGLIYGRHTNIR